MSPAHCTLVLHTLNFMLHDALVGGINASTRLDPGAKGMAQLLMRFPVQIPAALAAELENKGEAAEGY